MSIFAPNFNPNLIVQQLQEPTLQMALSHIERASKSFNRDILESFQTDTDYKFDDSVCVGTKWDREGIALEET